MRAVIQKKSSGMLPSPLISTYELAFYQKFSCQRTILRKNIKSDEHSETLMTPSNLLCDRVGLVVHLLQPYGVDQQYSVWLPFFFRQNIIPLNFDRYFEQGALVVLWVIKKLSAHKRASADEF